MTSWKSTVIPNRALHNRGRIVAKRSTRAQFGDRRFNSAFWSGVRWSLKHGARVSQVNAKPSVIWLGSKTLTYTYGDAGESLECAARIRIRIGRLRQVDHSSSRPPPPPPPPVYCRSGGNPQWRHQQNRKGDKGQAFSSCTRSVTDIHSFALITSRDFYSAHYTAEGCYGCCVDYEDDAQTHSKKRLWPLLA